MSQAVKDILERIEHLNETDRAELDEELALKAEAEWQREAAAAREQARLRGIDQATIDCAVEQARYAG